MTDNYLLERKKIMNEITDAVVNANPQNLYKLAAQAAVFGLVAGVAMYAGELTVKGAVNAVTSIVKKKTNNK